MKAARCSKCNINYPYDKFECPVCEQDLWEIEGETWDKDWQKKANALKNRWVIGKPLPNVDATLYEVQGHLFIADAMLKEYGYLDAMTDDVVVIQNRYFELQGEVHGKHDNGWWLKEIRPEEEFTDIPTLSAFDYKTLQSKRIR